MHTLLSAVQRLAISCRAHCLLRLIDRLWERRVKPSFRPALARQIRRQTARRVTHGRRQNTNFPTKKPIGKGCLVSLEATVLSRKNP